jgi:hypothetical protein
MIWVRVEIEVITRVCSGCLMYFLLTRACGFLGLFGCGVAVDDCVGEAVGSRSSGWAVCSCFRTCGTVPIIPNLL